MDRQETKRSEPPADAHRSNGASGPSPSPNSLSGEMFKVVVTVLGVTASQGYALWRSRATDGQQMLLPFGILALGMLLYLLHRARLAPTSRYWRYAACTQFAAAALIAYQLLPLQKDTPRREESSEPEAELVSVASDGRELEVKTSPNGVREVRLESSGLAKPRSVEITYRYRGELWSRRMTLGGCTSSDANVTCTIPRLEHSDAHFVDLDARRQVRVLAPSAGCEHIAGIGIRRGVELYMKHAGRELAVEVVDDDVDFSLETDAVADIGPYESAKTYRLLAACAEIDCAPVLALSSANALRDFERKLGKALLFRLTTDNRSRAQELAYLLRREFAADPAARSLYVLYDGEGVGSTAGAVGYSPDQAREMQRALQEGWLAQYPNIQVHYIEFERVTGTGEDMFVFREGAPFARKTRLSFTGFEEIIDWIRAGRDPMKRVVFIGRDMHIVQFGRARRAAYARTPDGNADVLLHVPGPSEILEGAATSCVDPLEVGHNLHETIVISPYGSMETAQGGEYSDRWRQAFPGQPASIRGGRAFDALSITATATTTLDAALRAERRHVDLQVYRRRLSAVIAAGSFIGTTGSYRFIDGEMHPANQVGIFIEGVGITKLPSLEELATPKPLRRAEAGLGSE